MLLFPDELPGGSETVEGDGNRRIRLGGQEPAAPGQRNGGSQGGGGVDIPILQRRQSLVSLYSSSGRLRMQTIECCR